MSNGIEVMKEKIRKKMTLDDLPSPKQPNTSEENVNQHTGAVQPYSNTAVHPHNNTDVQQNGFGKKKKGVVGDAAVQTVIHQNVEVDKRLAQNNGVQEDLHTDVQPYSNTAIQQNGFAEINRGESGDNALERTATQQAVPKLQDSQTEALGILKNEEAKIIRTENIQSKSLSQQNSNAATLQNSNATIHYNSNTAMQNDNLLIEINQMSEPQNSKTAVQQNSKTCYDEGQITQPIEQQNSNTVIRQNTAGSYFNNQMLEKNKTAYGRKMTLYLTEEMYKAFNDIYAKRMLEGRKTEKSALICEAVDLLRKHENE